MKSIDDANVEEWREAMKQADFRKLEKERDYWKRVAAHLASCHAATLEYDGSLKSVSRARKDRMLHIVSTTADLMEGRDGELGLGYARATPEISADRCRKAVAYFKEE